MYSIAAARSAQKIARARSYIEYYRWSTGAYTFSFYRVNGEGYLAVYIADDQIECFECPSLDVARIIVRAEFQEI
jgi:hypothetical protein